MQHSSEVVSCLGIFEIQAGQIVSGDIDLLNHKTWGHDVKPQTQRAFVRLLKRPNTFLWSSSSELCLLQPSACFSPQQCQSFMAQKNSYSKQGIDTSRGQAKWGIKTAVQGYKPAYKAANTALWKKNKSLQFCLFPSLRCQWSGLWKCITQCREAEFSTALISPASLFLLKFMFASDHHFQQKIIKATISTLFWLSTCRHRSIWSFWQWHHSYWYNKLLPPETEWPGLHIRYTKTDDYFRDNCFFPTERLL